MSHALMNAIENLAAMERQRQRTQPRPAPRRIYVRQEEPMPKPDGTTAMARLQALVKEPAYNTAMMKKKTGQAMTELEKTTLASAEREYRITRSTERRREDVRQYDGQPQSPPAANDHQDRSFQWRITREIALNRDAMARMNDARQVRAEVMAREGDYADAYWNANHPGHADAVANMQFLYEIAFPKE